MKTILYHGNCPDGFGAAFAAWLKFGNEAQYFSVSYGQPPPELQPHSEIFILDFSYPAKTLLEMGQGQEKVVVLDHHKTAQADLCPNAFMEVLGLDKSSLRPSGADMNGFIRCQNVWVKFDMEHSGAVLAWEYFHPDVTVPEFFLYLEDRDLWRFKLPMSREVSMAVRSYPMEFRTWTEMTALVSFGQIYELPGIKVDELKRQGQTCRRLTEQMVSAMAKHARYCFLYKDGHIGMALAPQPGAVWLRGDAWCCPAANATVFFSEVGERLLELYPDAPFSAYYSDRSDGKRQWGLRSRKEFDCSVIAKAFGGGGHAQASGFVQDL